MEQSYVDRNYITNGNHPINPETRDRNANEGRCREAQASTAFLFFGFVSFAASSVLTGLGTRGGASVRPSGIRRGPAMSQV